MLSPTTPDPNVRFPKFDHVQESFEGGHFSARTYLIAMIIVIAVTFFLAIVGR